MVDNQAEGFSPATVSRLKQKWAEDYKEDVKLCALVIVGINEHGEKHFFAIEDGIRESAQSWREVLLKLKNKGMNSPKLAVGDGGATVLGSNG